MQTSKTNVSPAPPGAAPGSEPGRFVCYKVKCPRGGLPPVAVTDQFGSRPLTLRTPKLVCAPVEGTTTTTTSTTTSTTTPECPPSAPCGTCGGGICLAHANPPPSLVCVDLAACAGFCTADANCPVGQVCAGLGTCCPLCP